MPVSFDPAAYGFDDSWCRKRKAIDELSQRSNYLVMGNAQMHLSVSADVSEKLAKLGSRLDFAKNDDGELVLYAGDARKVSAQVPGRRRRGTIALKPLREFYRVKFGPFKRLYMDVTEMDGAIRFTPNGERL